MDNYQKDNGHAIVVVLGDVGRSPRMCYHAASLANHGVSVDLVGYMGSHVHEKIASNSRIRIVPIKSPPQLAWCYRPLALALKLVWIFFATLATLTFFTRFKSSLILMQNPPGVPAMLICFLVSKLKGACFAIDWHNYTFSILDYCNHTVVHGHSTSIRSHILMSYVRMAAAWEGFWGRRAKWNLCVSKAMQTDLSRRWSVNALVLHDKAPSWMFRPLRSSARHDFLKKLLTYPELAALPKNMVSLDSKSHGGDEDGSETTIFSTKSPDGHVKFLSTRPLLLVSSTSWTEDEDFGILLDALREYDRHAHNLMNTGEKDALPKLLVVITGKGPLKDFYVEKIGKLHMQNVHVVTVWLAAEDYPKLLGSADLGVSLHMSTSGLDLPMKVVDMFGCNLPVLAKRFEAIGELVTDGTGLLFDTPQDLKRALVEVAGGFPDHSEVLHKLKTSCGGQLQANWEDQWDAVFWTVVKDCFEERKHVKERNRWRHFQDITSDATSAGDDSDDFERIDGKIDE